MIPHTWKLNLSCPSFISEFLLQQFWTPKANILLHVFSGIPDTSPEGHCVLTSLALSSKAKKWKLGLLANKLENKLKTTAWSWVLGFGAKFQNPNQFCSQFLNLWKLGSMEGQETKMLIQFRSTGSKLHR